jgi:DNA polymerase III subunit epsilon
MVVTRQRIDELLLEKKAHDRAEAIAWASTLTFNDNWCILDTETTGVDDCAEIIQLGIIDSSKIVLLNTLIQPFNPISPEATRVNGLTLDYLNDAPTWNEIQPVMDEVLSRHKISLILTYNRAFDQRLYRQSCRIAGTQPSVYDWDCIMIPYSKFIGKWDYEHRSYAYPKLPNARHGAIEDCFAAYEVLFEMTKG